MGKPSSKKTLRQNLKSDFRDSISLDKLISSAMKSPHFKVDRDTFLTEEFSDLPQEIAENIISTNPIVAGISREELRQRAENILNNKISSAEAEEKSHKTDNKEKNLSTEIIEFYSIALKTAQEISYLYGEKDLWKRSSIDSREIKNQLMLYCAVMLGAAGAAKTVKVFASSLAKEAKKKMLKKIFYYPLIKVASKLAGRDVTMKSLSESISYSIPAAGEFVSDGIALATLLPMGNRLIDTFDKAHFDYSKEEFENDIKEFAEENNVDT